MPIPSRDRRKRLSCQLFCAVFLERRTKTDLKRARQPIVSAVMLGAVGIGGTDRHPRPVIGVVGRVVRLKPELALDSLVERDLLADGPVRHKDAWPAQVAYL